MEMQVFSRLLETCDQTCHILRAVDRDLVSQAALANRRNSY